MREREGGASGHVTVVYLSSLDEVTAIKQTGCMLPDDLMIVRKCGLRWKLRVSCWPLLLNLEKNC